jgi:uncharacterized protein DUF4926
MTTRLPNGDEAIVDLRKVEPEPVTPAWPASAAARHLLGAMMNTKERKNDRPSLLDVVALLTDLPAQQLARGQVGTIVEELDDKTLLVEFSDDQGRAYAIAPCARTELLVLHYVPEAA